MLNKHLQQNALPVIQAFVILGRTFALEDRANSQIADLMDGVEYLLALIIEPEDSSERFVAYARELAARYSCIRAEELLKPRNDN